MKKENTKKKISRKDKILKAAKKLFSANGFEGTTVEAIADEAKVNKALIYYYFKNKSDIMERLIDDFVSRTTYYKEKVLSNFKNHELLQSAEKLNGFMHDMLNHFKDDEDVLRIALRESLKPGQIPFLRRMMNYMSEDDPSRLIKKAKDMGFKMGGETIQMLVTQFFTSGLPFILYVIYREKWAKFFGITTEELDQKFIIALDQTHFEYHRKSIEHSNSQKDKKLNS
ncbi:MAG: TetR/AcrR family transcriptional regulator [Deltaproteobacteria bacterium]|nr:TetR/AcrR family transcriptional regulator [Deltaproteobacteria bacterium]